MMARQISKVMENKSKYYIYKIVSPTGRIYVGKTNNLEKRFSHYKAKYKMSQPLLNRSLKKYGWEAHTWEVLEEGYDTHDNVNEREMFYIKELQSFHYDNPNGLNLTLGGEGGRVGKGRRKLTEKQREVALKCLEKANEYNKKYRVYKPLTQEQKDNLREKNLGENSPVGKVIINLENGIYYDTIREAADSLNINVNSLRGKLTGNWKNGKTQFSYAYEKDIPENKLKR